MFSVSTNGTSNNLTYADEGGVATGAVDTWYHIAISRVGNNMYYFWDGVLTNTVDVTGMTIYAGTSKFYLGTATLNGPNYEHNLDNVRLTKGVGRYTTSFTPPGVPYQGSSGTVAFIVGDPAYTTQIDGLTTNITSALDVSGNTTIASDFLVNNGGIANFGDPGLESGSIMVGGVSYDAVVKVNEFGGAQDAAMVLHRHSDTPAISANLLMARARSDTSAHTDVADADHLVGLGSLVGTQQAITGRQRYMQRLMALRVSVICRGNSAF